MGIASHPNSGFWAAKTNIARGDLPIFTLMGDQRGEDDDARWSFEHRAGPKGKRVAVNGYKLRAGITGHVRIHDFRHTCASHLAMGTWGYG